MELKQMKTILIIAIAVAFPCIRMELKPAIVTGYIENFGLSLASEWN